MDPESKPKYILGNCSAFSGHSYICYAHCSVSFSALYWAAIMEKRIGLTFPLVFLILFALIYHPYFTKYFLKAPWQVIFLSPQSFFLVAVFFIARWKNLSLYNLGLGFDRPSKDLRLGLLLGLLPVVTVLLLALTLTSLNSFLHFLPGPLFGGESYSTWSWYQLAVLLVLAPISEELFFRGILFKALLEQYSVWFSILFSSLIFMACHGNLTAGPLVLGVINAMVFYRTGSLLPGIIFHSFSNAYAPIMTLWFPNLSTYLRFFYV